MQGRIKHIGDRHGYLLIEDSRGWEMTFSFQGEGAPDFKILAVGDRVSFFIGDKPDGRYCAVEVRLLWAGLREKRLAKLAAA